MRNKLPLVLSVIVLITLGLLYFLFKGRLSPTPTPLDSTATPKPFVGVVQELPDLPPPAGVDNEPATSLSPDPINVPNAIECEGATGSQLQQCCAEWGHRTKTIQVECIGSWQFVNDTCAYTCSSSVAQPTPDTQPASP